MLANAEIAGTLTRILVRRDACSRLRGGGRRALHELRKPAPPESCARDFSGDVVPTSALSVRGGSRPAGAWGVELGQPALEQNTIVKPAEDCHPPRPDGER